MAQKLLQLCIDWGTANLSASYSLPSVDPERIENVRFRFISEEAPMMAAMHEGHLVWGYDLQALILKHKVAAEDVIEFFKLALYDQDGAQPERVARVTAQLEQNNMSLDLLIQLHLRAVVDECLREVRDSEDKLLTPGKMLHELDVTDVGLRLSVPQMWSPTARRRMLQAAKLAGFTLVALASEPQCALASLVNKVAKKTVRLPRPLLASDAVTAVDVGCGTTDIVTYRLVDDLSEHSRFEAVSQESGAFCAGQMVNDLLLDVFETSGEVAQRGGFRRVCNDLGITEHEGRRQALAEIERLKLEYERLPRYRICLLAPFKGEATFDSEFT